MELSFAIFIFIWMILKPSITRTIISYEIFLKHTTLLYLVNLYFRTIKIWRKEFFFLNCWLLHEEKADGVDPHEEGLLDEENGVQPVLGDEENRYHPLKTIHDLQK